MNHSPEQIELIHFDRLESYIEESRNVWPIMSHDPAVTKPVTSEYEKALAWAKDNPPKPGDPEWIDVPYYRNSPWPGRFMFARFKKRFDDNGYMYWLCVAKEEKS